MLFKRSVRTRVDCEAWYSCTTHCNYLSTHCRHHPFIFSTTSCSQQAINGRLHCNASIFYNML